MDWYEKLNKICKENNAEIMRVPNGALFIICAKEPDNHVKNSIAEIIPVNINCKYVENVKPSTFTVLKRCFSHLIEVGFAAWHSDNKNLNIVITGMLAEAPDWSPISDALAKDGYFDRWSVTVNGQEVYAKSRLELELQKKIADNSLVRDRALTDDDVLNVKITLANAKTVDDFIASV